ncbi:MAG: c-type cytochrome [Verrucomicrobia bacterium]|nr:c-type cytochrome [Verrucomicrobiota bacterium]
MPLFPFQSGSLCAASRARTALAVVLMVVAVRAQDSTLPPAEPLLPESALPDYEKNLDHAALIRGWNKASLARGEKIYQFVCHACHGDLNLAGSLPTALRFAEGKFSHGADPLTMYRTVTRGWRQMPPQVQLVPREKYDVIHYIRETFLRDRNPGQLFDVSPDYLAGLPNGTTTGPAPVKREPWREMDYGPFLIGTFELADAAWRDAAAGLPSSALDTIAPGSNLAYKGVALRLDSGPGGVSAGKAWLVFEHDTLRVAGAWTGAGFIDWEGINFNGRHVVHPRTIGDLHFETADAPGWADPVTGKFDDPRLTGLDGLRYGPLPRAWQHYRGLYRSGDRVVISYTVGDAAILESHDLETLAGQPVFVRTLNIGKSSRDLRVRVANAGTAVAVSGSTAVTAHPEAGFVVLRIPAAASPLRLAVRLAKAGTAGLAGFAAAADAPRDLAPFTRGGPARWPDVIETPIVRSDASGAFAWERFTLPQANPWRARLRLSGLDFSRDGHTAFVCTWDGDVWQVDGIGGNPTTVKWRRIASGLFQPLGLRLRAGTIYVTCRDQLVALRDLNGDGEIDFFENVNSDHQVTNHFHEFAMGLQTDAAGNFYYAKSARHARTPLVPQHGTLLKISADGARTEILANGFRAANGVCLNPDGSFFVTDQEGHWMPMNRVNRVTPGKFFGNMWSYGAPDDSSDSAMAPPMLWIDKAFDRSPGELLWLNSPRWGALDGALLNLSYGQGRIEIVVADGAGDDAQGATCRLPIPDFPTGIMRGRVHPTDGQLYLCGLSAWATSQTEQEGGFYRLCPTGKPAALPTAWRIARDGIDLTYSEAIDPAVAGDLARYVVKVWELKRTANYGSPRVNEHALPITRAETLADRRTLRLTIPSLAPATIVEITCRVKDATGAEVTRVVTGTIHRVPGSGPAAVAR